MELNWDSSKIGIAYDELVIQPKEECSANHKKLETTKEVILMYVLSIPSLRSPIMTTLRSI